MLTKTIQLWMILVLTMTLAIACGQETPTQTNPVTTESQQDQRQEPSPQQVAQVVDPTEQSPESTATDTSPAQVVAPPQPAITAAITRDTANPAGTTEQSEPVEATSTAEPATVTVATPQLDVATPGPVSEESQAPTSEPTPTPTPVKPQFSEAPLLQDIYAGVNLEVYGLNPNKELEFYYLPDVSRPFEEYRDHPYLHIFPDVEHAVREIQEEAYSRGRSHPREFEYEYHPYPRGFEANSTRKNYGIETFLHSPWFEEWSDGTIGSARTTEANKRYREAIESINTDYFGKGSVKETLANAVADLVNQAVKEQAREYQIPWKYDPPRVFSHPETEKYLRVAFTPYTGNRRVRPPYEAYLPPRTSWDFLDPELPIVKVHADYKTSLPYVTDEMQQVLEYTDGVPTASEFSISFVIAFQHRWTTFQDGNRWIIKFQEDLQPETNPHGPGTHVAAKDIRECVHFKCTWEPKDGTINPALQDRYPNYWHTSDYMQHSLIGPVVMTVHESDVLEVGTYSVLPAKNYWEAPGPIIDVAQALAPRGIEPILGQGPPTYKQKYSFTTSVNPGYPLPGHVLTNQFTDPGTDIWNSYNLGAEWE